MSAASTKRGTDIALLCDHYGAAELVRDFKRSILALHEIADLIATHTGPNGKPSAAALAAIRADVQAREYQQRKHTA